MLRVLLKKCQLSFAIVAKKYSIPVKSPSDASFNSISENPLTHLASIINSSSEIHPLLIKSIACEYHFEKSQGQDELTVCVCYDTNQEKISYPSKQNYKLLWKKATYYNDGNQYLPILMQNDTFVGLSVFPNVLNHGKITTYQQIQWFLQNHTSQVKSTGKAKGTTKVAKSSTPAVGNQVLPQPNTIGADQIQNIFATTVNTLSTQIASAGTKSQKKTSKPKTTSTKTKTQTIDVLSPEFEAQVAKEKLLQDQKLSQANQLGTNSAITNPSTPISPTTIPPATVSPATTQPSAIPLTTISSATTPVQPSPSVQASPAVDTQPKVVAPPNVTSQKSVPLEKQASKTPSTGGSKKV